MSFTSFGTFSRYEPDPSYVASFGNMTTAFIRNERGDNFYELRDTLFVRDGPAFVSSEFDAFFTVQDERILVVNSDPSRFYPEGLEFWGYFGSDPLSPGDLFDGVSISPAPAVEPDPFRPLSPAEFWVAALSIGVTEIMVDAAIEQMAEPARSVATIRKGKSTQFLRDDELVVSLLTAMGKSPAEVDAAWLAAPSFG